MGTLEYPAHGHKLIAIRPIRKAIILPLGSAAGKSGALFPASAAMSPLLFPLVDRDGLTKPLLQIIAEDAIGSGIESLAVIAAPEVEAQCRHVFQDWTGKSVAREDGVNLQREKLAAVSHCLQYIAPASEHAFLAARAFVGDDDFAFLPSDVLYASETADRCLEQLIRAASAHASKCVLAVQTIVERQVLESIVVHGNERKTEPASYAVAECVENPDIDRCARLSTPGLPPRQYLAASGMAILTPAIFDALMKHHSLPVALNELATAGGVAAAPMDVASFDLRNPYGWLAAQLGLGLLGVHRVEICELITRTLASQIKS